MLIRRSVAILTAIALLPVLAHAAGDTYPTRPLRIVTAEAGGGADYVARVVAAELTSLLGQQVIIDNRRGGSGVIAIETAARAQPDGYTMLVYNNGMWILPLLRKVSYDPVKDFAPVAAVVKTTNVLVVHPSLEARSTGDLIALAKRKPGELNFASAGSGSTTHLAGELFNAMAGVKMTHVPYKGSASALNDLLGGRVPVMFPNAASVMTHVKAGRLRALAVTSRTRSALLPDLPPVAASGLPGYESVVTFALFVPAKTPQAVISRLHAAVATLLAKDEVRGRFANVAAEPSGDGPRALAQTITDETQKLGRVIRDAGIRED
jgi:tripartite-type tricarboxylate transporter receptor subunit TctC